MQSLGQDLRYGVRIMLKNRTFTVVVILTLALGIGANSAIFSLVDHFLLRALPVKDPQQLVSVRAARPNGGTTGSFAYPAFEEIRDLNNSFSGIFAYDGSHASATFDGQPDYVDADFVSGSYFDVLGVSAILGRTFTSDDDRPGVTPVVVISHGYWKRRFARDPAVIGKTIYVGKVPLTVVGVTSPEFSGLHVAGGSADLVLPM